MPEETTRPVNTGASQASWHALLLEETRRELAAPLEMGLPNAEALTKAYLGWRER